MNTSSRYSQAGAVNGTLVAVIFLVIAVIGLGALSGWLYVSYQKASTNVDGQVKLAAAKATKQQADADAKKYEELKKLPNRTFAGPDDYGRLTFKYPKNWSVYIAETPVGGSGSDFMAYLNPGVVPPVNADNQRFALRVSIISQNYDDTIAEYQDQVSTGELKSRPVSANNHDGTRLDGKLSDEIRGAVVIYKIRDKTAIIQTDANTFLKDFNRLVQTIQFNQ